MVALCKINRLGTDASKRDGYDWIVSRHYYHNIDHCAMPSLEPSVCTVTIYEAVMSFPCHCSAYRASMQILITLCKGLKLGARLKIRVRKKRPEGEGKETWGMGPDGDKTVGVGSACSSAAGSFSPPSFRSQHLFDPN